MPAGAIFRGSNSEMTSIMTSDAYKELEEEQVGKDFMEVEELVGKVLNVCVCIYIYIYIKVGRKIHMMTS